MYDQQGYYVSPPGRIGACQSLPRSRFFRRTLAHTVSCEGIGLHSGVPVTMHLRPGEPGQGILFHRTDGNNGNTVIPASYLHICSTNFATTLGVGEATVGTVEHLMAALFSCGIDDASIVLDGPEVPIMDGSAAHFIKLLHQAGLTSSSLPLDIISIKRKVSLSLNGKEAHAEPADTFSVRYIIDFPSTIIGHQDIAMEISEDTFARSIARARTFGFLSQADKLRQNGLIRGASEDNAIVIGDNKVLNPDGLRYHDEFVRHKLLDMVGDLALAQAPLLGRFYCSCGGHELTQKLLDAIFSDPRNYERSSAISGHTSDDNV